MITLFTIDISNNNIFTEIVYSTCISCFKGKHWPVNKWLFPQQYIYHVFCFALVLLHLVVLICCLFFVCL